jgi:hypothetical protein
VRRPCLSDRQGLRGPGTEEDPSTSLDVTRAEAHLHEARQRLEHARSSRLTQLQALDEIEQTADDHLLCEDLAALRANLNEQRRRARHLTRPGGTRPRAELVSCRGAAFLEPPAAATRLSPSGGALHGVGRPSVPHGSSSTGRRRLLS